MKIGKWFEQFKDRLNKEEVRHLDIHKAIIKMQFKNPVTGEIEIHQWDYTAKDAQHLERVQ